MFRKKKNNFGLYWPLNGIKFFQTGEFNSMLWNGLDICEWLVYRNMFLSQVTTNSLKPKPGCSQDFLV